MKSHLLDLLYSVPQSNSFLFSITDVLEMTITVLKPPIGGGRVSIQYKSDYAILQCVYNRPRLYKCFIVLIKKHYIRNVFCRRRY